MRRYRSYIREREKLRKIIYLKEKSGIQMNIDLNIWESMTNMATTTSMLFIEMMRNWYYRWQVRMPSIQTSTTQQEELRLFQQLVDSSFIDEIPEKGDMPLPDFNPLPAKGKPASEIIIEERGER